MLAIHEQLLPQELNGGLESGFRPRLLLFHYSLQLALRHFGPVMLSFLAMTAQVPW
jgi:hypothetical protein